MQTNLLKKYYKYIPLCVLSTVLSIIVPLLFSYLIDTIIIGQQYDKLFYWLLGTLIFSIFSEIFKCYYSQYYPIKKGIENSKTMTINTVDDILKLDYNEFEKKDKGFYYNVLSHCCAVYGDLHVVVNLQLVSNIISVILLVILGFVINIYLGIIITIFIPIMIITTLLKSKPLYKMNKEVMTKQDDSLSSLKDVIEQKEQINIIGVNDYFLNRVNVTETSFNKFMVKYRFHTTFSEFLPTIISNIYNVIFFGIGAYLIVKNQFTTGLLVLGYQYINILSNPILDICSIIVRYKSNSENIQRVDDLHELALTPIDHSNQTLNNGLLFEANQFSYHLYSNNQLLFNIHEYLSLDKSGLYLIKGGNGVGKSMFINLLIGKEKIDNCEGQFNVTNDIQQYSYLTYPHLFINGSIENNMFGIAMNHQVKDMLNIDFENKEITTNPLNLSLGQQQKLSLLRTLSKPALYYLLDEPMSNLDTRTQSNLVNYIKHLKKDKTVIVIVHDNSLDTIADKTIFIHDQKMEVI